MTRKLYPTVTVRSLLKFFHEDRSGATSTEYILIMALVVLPIGLLCGPALKMVQLYGARVISLMGMPFP